MRIVQLVSLPNAIDKEISVLALTEDGRVLGKNKQELLDINAQWTTLWDNYDIGSSINVGKTP